MALEMKEKAPVNDTPGEAMAMAEKFWPMPLFLLQGEEVRYLSRSTTTGFTLTEVCIDTVTFACKRQGDVHRTNAALSATFSLLMRGTRIRQKKKKNKTKKKQERWRLTQLPQSPIPPTSRAERTPTLLKRHSSMRTIAGPLPLHVTLKVWLATTLSLQFKQRRMVALQTLGLQHKDAPE
ncbi:hypothetical protein PoB_005161000 [Plakobranchus ocellatus]|uniref:Uncharacterized protein n=1 Tax=Plakobranchus ocellatus TaxID=259542 RepID=A0AAV4BXH3_9GAST|nr:hypothetical protein PoB_005161000 [Plakobranchus ocellatus]